MKLLVIGSGAREHALTWALARDPGVTALACAPGNPGIAELARVIPGQAVDPGSLVALARAEHADLTVVGPELPLSRGVVDAFADAGLSIVGPTRAAAALESSKAFAKSFMARHGVPTARHRTCTSEREALDVLASGDLGVPVVVKADGLAAGKGVVVAPSRLEAESAVHAIMGERRFGEAGARVVLEECLTGVEMSFFVLTDGEHAMPMGSAQDHKRAFDEDRGPNTGGMGAFAPSPLCTPELQARIMREIAEPVIAGMRAEGTPFAGFLYCGLMLTAAGPKVIEFNVRFGDPEAQVVLPLVDEPLLPLLVAAAEGGLPARPARMGAGAAVGVVLASGGYPDAFETGKPIAGLAAAAAEPGVHVFHAGTAQRDGRIVTAGGRVLTVVGRGADHREAMQRAYAGAAHIRFEGMHLRSDIGTKALG